MENLRDLVKSGQTNQSAAYIVASYFAKEQPAPVMPKTQPTYGSPKLNRNPGGKIISITVKDAAGNEKELGYKDFAKAFNCSNEEAKKIRKECIRVIKNGGNVAKVLKTEKKTAAVFEKHGLNIKELASNSDRTASNKTIMDKLSQSKEFAQDLIESLKPKKAGGANAVLKRARSLNSFVSAAATFFFVPAFLGIVLPKFVYGMTAKRQKKLAEQRAAYEATLANNGGAANTNAAKAQVQQKVDYTKLKSASNSTFQSMKSHA